MRCSRSTGTLPGVAVLLYARLEAAPPLAAAVPALAPIRPATHVQVSPLAASARARPSRPGSEGLAANPASGNISRVMAISNSAVWCLRKYRDARDRRASGRLRRRPLTAAQRPLLVRRRAGMEGPAARSAQLYESHAQQPSSTLQPAGALSHIPAERRHNAANHVHNRLPLPDTKLHSE